MNKTKEQIKSTIKDHLESRDEIIFAYVFGSFIRKESYRDIDIGIFTEEDLDLIEIGRIQTELQNTVDDRVEVVQMQLLPAKNPRFAFSIVTEGELLFTRDREKHSDYKRQVLLRYFDTAPLRAMMDQAFEDRIESGKFGYRDYK